MLHLRNTLNIKRVQKEQLFTEDRLIRSKCPVFWARLEEIHTKPIAKII